LGSWGSSSVVTTGGSRAHGGTLYVAATQGSWAGVGLLSVAIMGEVRLIGDCHLLGVLEELGLAGEHHLLPLWGKLSSGLEISRLRF